MFRFQVVKESGPWTRNLLAIIPTSKLIFVINQTVSGDNAFHQTHAFTREVEFFHITMVTWVRKVLSEAVRYQNVSQCFRHFCLN